MARKESTPSSSSGGPLRALVFLLVALVAGVASLVLVYQSIQYYQREIAKAEKEEDTVLVIVAARDLYQGLTITEEDLVAVEIPPKHVPQGVFLSPEYVVGQVPRERILANEFIRKERLADRATGVGLNAIISRGMRAVSININNARALSGFLNPGNYVDIVVTMKPEREPHTTFTLLQAVYVLAVNDRVVKDNAAAEEEVQAKNAKKKKKKRPSVTLQVTPEQAEQVAHAQFFGDLTLTLRNDLDLQFTETAGATNDTLLGRKEEEKKPVRRRVPKQEKDALTIWKGTRSQKYEYDSNP